MNKLGKFFNFVTKDSVVGPVVLVAGTLFFWDEIPTWLSVGILIIVGQIVFWVVAYRLGEERRKFFIRLNNVFDSGSEDAKRQFHQRETVAALDDIARAARSIKGILWVIAILLFLLLARTIN
jgi:hypothetical protein